MFCIICIFAIWVILPKDVKDAGSIDGLKKQQTNEGRKDPSVVVKIQRCGYNFFYELLKPRGYNKYS